MSEPSPLPTEAEVRLISDPDLLLHKIWEAEPLGGWSQRDAMLDRLEQLLANDELPKPPPGRDWRLEYLAERATNLGRVRELDAALALVDEVVRAAGPDQHIALGRATLVGGQALAWVGTDAATKDAIAMFTDAVRHFRALGDRDWTAAALMRWGFYAHYQYGEVLRGEEIIRQALDTIDPQSRRRVGIVPTYADLLIELGELDRAESLLTEALEHCEQYGPRRPIYEICWGLARVSAARGAGEQTLSWLRRTERTSREIHGDEFFTTHIGAWYLLTAAEMLDRLGMSAEAERYFERGAATGGMDEEVTQARAVMLARGGDPERALMELQAIARGDWLEKRLIWRHTLMAAWASFRLGRVGIGPQVARALEQAQACGTVMVAVAGEPDLTIALAPEAERCGSPLARALLLGDERRLVIRLFGPTSVRTAIGEELSLPSGMPGELVRRLAVHQAGLPVPEVLAQLFPGAEPEAARPRLRQVLARLRASAGELVVRDGETLKLVPAWVDLREFLAAAARAKHARGARAVQLAYGALVIVQPGSPLPEHVYDEWAEDVRDAVNQAQLQLLRVIIADASARGSHQEALTAIEQALVLDPENRELRDAMGVQLRALGRPQAAGYLEQRPDR